MVSIFTYRDERKLFAVIGVVIVAALIALVQLDSVRRGTTSPINLGLSTAFAYGEMAVAYTGTSIRGAIDTAVKTPGLMRENETLHRENDALRSENTTLRETVALAPEARALVSATERYPSAIVATVIGFDPENKQQVITIDRGRTANVALDDGVVTVDGIVGRVSEVGPVSSKVLLLTAFSSNVPAIVQRGRWWGIASGTLTRVSLRYVSQDAKLRVGDTIVTGEGRSFHAGALIGHIKEVPLPAAGALDQTVVVEPAAAFGRLTHVLVVKK